MMITLLALLLILAVSWGVTVGLIALICLCFHLTFDLLIATGIWLVFLLIKWLLGGSHD